MNRYNPSQNGKGRERNNYYLSIFIQSESNPNLIDELINQLKPSTSFFHLIHGWYTNLE